jgi:hypothetical protein
MILRVLAICLCLLALTVGVMPQQNSSASRKFDEFGDMIADDVMPRLDNFALELGKHPNLTGYIIGHNGRHILIGSFLRRLYGYQNYLVNTRRIDLRLVKVIEGGNKDHLTTELWLVPDGSAPPEPSSEMKMDIKSPLKFDKFSMGIGCEPEFTLDLYELNDGLKFYASALRENPDSRAWIIFYPNRRDRLSKAAGIARQTKNLLTKEFHIEANRLLTRVSNRRRTCMEAELWLVPPGAVLPVAAPQTPSPEVPN